MLARPRRTPSTRTSTTLRLLSGVGAVVAAGAMIALPTALAPSAAAWCTPSGALRAESMPSRVAPSACDLRGRTIASGTAQVAVPARGHGVSAVDHGPAGESTLFVLTDARGVVSVSRKQPSQPAAAGAAVGVAPKAAAATPVACRDGAYATMGYKFSGTFNWRLNTAGTPKYLGASATPNILAATSDVARGSNKCGYSRAVRLSQHFLGTTTKKPQVTSAGTCESGGDGVSVTGWKPLSKVLAYTCSYYTWNGQKWVVSESDMALSTSFRWFTFSAPRGCRYVFDLRGVVVHERGHTFGLGHVDYKSHASLTMSPYSAPCTTANRWLGYGDYRGLAQMYGSK